MLRYDVVEWLCRITTAMVGAEYGYSVGILLHPFKCHMFRAGDAGLGRTGMLCSVGKGGDTAS
jgi:predicted component of type VI protein secretion system